MEASGIITNSFRSPVTTPPASMTGAAAGVAGEALPKG